MNDEPLSLPGKAIVPVVKSLTYHPAELHFNERVQDKAIELTFSPHMADMRLLVGKGGRLIRALRFIAEEIGNQHGYRCDVKLEESYRGTPDKLNQFPSTRDFSRNLLLGLLSPILVAGLGTLPAMEFRDGEERLVVSLDLPESKTNFVSAVSDVFYPWGRRHGGKVTIKTRFYEYSRSVLAG